MRITKAIQERIFENLLASHPLQERAIAVTLERQKMLLDLITEIAKREGLDGSQAALRAEYDRLNSLTGDSFFFHNNVYRSVISPGVDGDGDITSYSHTSATVYCAGQSRAFYIDGDTDDATLTVKDVTPARFEFDLGAGLFEVMPTDNGRKAYYSFYLPRSSASLAADHWFVKAVDANDAERRAIRGEFTTLKSTVFATLNKFSTSKKLVEAWPEIMIFLPKSATPAGTGLALSREDLNAICGLPK